MNNHEIIVEEHIPLKEEYAAIIRVFSKYLAHPEEFPKFLKKFKLKANDNWTDEAFEDYLKDAKKNSESFERFLGTQDNWGSEKTVYRFDDNSLYFKTEQIYPKLLENHIPIMLLFSNPHPGSVAHSLFFSESGRSGCFWRRLCYDSFHIHIPTDILNLNQPWKKIPIKELGETMLKAKYISLKSNAKLLLYFQCYYSLPTKEPNDISTIFAGTEAHKFIETTSLNSLVAILNRYNIRNIVAFTQPLFENLTGKNVSSWKSIVDEHGSQTIQNEFPERSEFEKRQALLSITAPGITLPEIKVYMALHTGAHYKNKKNNKGQYYFTLILDAIFDKISHPN